MKHNVRQSLVSFFFQVHCISTEFTQRKNGGEKGAPFRIQVDTYKPDSHGSFTEHLYSCSCQVKVFKVLICRAVFSKILDSQCLEQQDQRENIGLFLQKGIS